MAHSESHQHAKGVLGEVGHVFCKKSKKVIFTFANCARESHRGTCDDRILAIASYEIFSLGMTSAAVNFYRPASSVKVALGTSQDVQFE